MGEYWTWQRLYKKIGDVEVLSVYASEKDSEALSITDEEMNDLGFVWLCPEPNFVKLSSFPHWATLSNSYYFAQQ